MVLCQNEPNHEKYKHNKKLVLHQPKFYLRLSEEHGYLEKNKGSKFCFFFDKKELRPIQVVKYRVLHESNMM